MDQATSLPHLSLRQSLDADWPTIRAICCETARDGAGIPSQERPAFTDLWIRPYQELLPQWTWVACQQSQVIGYLTGCPDTPQFEAECRARGFPLSPSLSWSSKTRRLIAEHFPAHLHLNIAPHAQKAGVGRKLLSTYFKQLRGHEVPGVHLFCGKNPLSFYLRAGFECVETLELTSQKSVYCLAFRLPETAPLRSGTTAK